MDAPKLHKQFLKEVIKSIGHKSATSDQELRAELAKRKINAKVMGRDEFLNASLKPGQMLIVNTHNAGMGHWVAFRQQTKKAGYMYCSDGYTPQQLFGNDKNKNPKVSAEQKPGEQLCGHLAIAWLMGVKNPKTRQAFLEMKY